MPVANIAPNKRYLATSQNEPFFVLGVNYNGYFDRTWRMWGSDWFDRELIARDFGKAKHSGFNTVRLAVDADLAQDIKQDEFKKLDHVLEVAQAEQLSIILTLNDSHDLDLEAVGQLDAKLCQHYADHSTILAYDLESEPTFRSLAAAIYPAASQPDIQTSKLIDHYGVQVHQDKVADLRTRRHLPAHLNDEAAFHYVNALRLFRKYQAALQTYEREGRGTPFDFMVSDEAAPWYPLISTLETLVECWLATRIKSIREAGCQHLLTVGWSQLLFSLLPANRLLDFQSYQQAVPLSLLGFNTTLAHLGNLRRSFPEHPILLSGFGWSNQTPSQQSVDSRLTALYETATFAYLRADSFAGGCKSILNDVEEADGHEAHLGVFETGNQVKPIGNLIERFAEACSTVHEQALYFSAIRDVQSGLTYRFDLPQQITVGGHTYQDNAISWQAADLTGHCFIKRDLEQLIVEATSSGQLSLDPWNVVPIWNKGREANVYRVYSDSSRTLHTTALPSETVTLSLQPGAQYLIKMGFEPAEQTIGSSQLEPKLGEHVLLLANSDSYLGAALPYIRRFAPDLSFAPDEVAGRWSYISVVATPEEISDDVLDDMRSLGVAVVERLMADTPEETANLLDELAQQGQRFLTPHPTVAMNGMADDQEAYHVQPGDSLSKIATKLYGDFQLGQLIYQANQDQIINPRHLPVGLELRIPDPS